MPDSLTAGPSPPAPPLTRSLHRRAPQFKPPSTSGAPAAVQVGAELHARLRAPAAAPTAPRFRSRAVGGRGGASSGKRAPRLSAAPAPRPLGRPTACPRRPDRVAAPIEGRNPPSGAPALAIAPASRPLLGAPCSPPRRPVFANPIALRAPDASLERGSRPPAAQVRQSSSSPRQPAMRASLAVSTDSGAACGAGGQLRAPHAAAWHVRGQAPGAGSLQTRWRRAVRAPPAASLPIAA